MAEEQVVYDQVGGPGDPSDPLGIRQKLSQKGGGNDPLGIRAKLSTPKVTESKPESSLQFQPMTNWLSMPQGHTPKTDQGPVIPKEDFTKVPKEAAIKESTAVKSGFPTQPMRSVGESTQKVINHLSDIDESVASVIRDQKHKNELNAMANANVPIQDATANVALKQYIRNTLPDKGIDVSNDEVQSFKNQMQGNEPLARAALNKKVKILQQKDPERAKDLSFDLYNLDAKNRNSKEKLSNLEKIKNGEFVYDPENKIVKKPEGFWESLVSSRKDLNKLFDDYDYYSSNDKPTILNKLENDYKNYNPDKPVPTPDGYLGHIGAFLGGNPIKGIAAGAVAGGLTGVITDNPAAAAAASKTAMAGVSAVDFYKMAKANGLRQYYNTFRSQGMKPEDAYSKADELSEKQAKTDAVTAAAMGFIGGGESPNPIKLSTLFKKSVIKGLEDIGEHGAKKVLQGTMAGSVGAVGQIIKNQQAQQAGIHVKDFEGVGDQLMTGINMTLGATLAGKVPELLKPKTYNNIIHGLSKIPEETRSQEFEKLQQAEVLTPEQVQKVNTDIQEAKKIDSSIPETIGETDRLKVQAKIKERNLLQDQLEKVDTAYHPDLKERIKSLNEEIVNISKGADKEGLQKLIHQEAQAGKIQGYTADLLQNATENELNGYMKDIAEQAHDPNSAAITEETFGKKIVEKAKELYPKVEQPSEAGAGKVPAEKVGGVDVSEHGEDTKTQAGQENGTKPSKLSRAGTTEAKELGKYMAGNGQTKVMSSPVERAHETAKTAAEEASRITGKDVPVETNDLLKTWNIGEYDGKPEGSFSEEEWIKKPNESPKGGESFNDFTKRMEQAGAYIKTLPEDTHVVTHSKVMRALYALDKTGGKWTDETTNIFLNNKELSHALPIEKSNALDVRQQTPDGEGMGAGNIQPEITTGKEEGTTEEKNIPEGQEKVKELTVDEAYGLPFIEEAGDKRTGIKNIISKTTRFERRLPDVEVGKLGSDQQVLEEGKNLVNTGVINPVEVVNRILETKGGMEPDEAKAMQYYMHQLSQHDTNLRETLAHTSDEVDRANINSQLQQLSDEIDAATQANIISGKAWSDVGNIRQIVSDTGFNASRDLATIKEAYGGKIPEEVQKRLDQAIKERDEARNNLAKLQAEQTKKLADETVKKAGTKNPKKTKGDFEAERDDIKKSISDKLKKGRTGESGLTAVPLPFAKEIIEITPDLLRLVKSYAEEGIQKTEEVINRLHDVLKDELPNIQKADIVNFLAGKYKEEERRLSPLAQRVRDFRMEANLWTKIAVATKMEEDTPAKKQEKNDKIRMLKDRLNEIKTRNKEATKSIQEILTSDAAKELKKLEQRRKSAETQLRNKKFLQAKETKNIPLSTEIVKEQQRIVNAQYKIRTEKRKAFESQKNFYQKALMWAGRGFRLSILSGYNVLAKLAAASTIGGAIKRIPEQAIGYIYGQAFKGIAEKAPIEGFVSAQAESKFYKEFFNPKTFAKNAIEILKTGESPLSKKFSTGQYEHIPGLYLPTDLHQIIKDPLKRATYEASLQNALVWAERNGLDINDDLVRQSLETAAYKRAQYEIFQESNVLSRKFGEWKNKMEQSGNIGATGKFLADFLVPVSTVPTNIARRVVTTSPFGLIRGAAKVVDAYRKGIETLKPEEADVVMKQLKQGTLGTALWMVGWFGWQAFGGLYSKFNPNKSRDQGDLQSDEMSVGGKMIPKPVQHALPLEIIQFAATARRVYDHYNDKGASDFESTEKAGLAAIGGLVEQIPILESGAHAIGATTDPYEAKKLEEDVKRRFQPQILKETGIIGKDSGGSGGGGGSTGSYKRVKPIKLSKPHKIYK
jgi:broad specificity phosphatase PhoE